MLLTEHFSLSVIPNCLYKGICVLIPVIPVNVETQFSLFWAFSPQCAT